MWRRRQEEGGPRASPSFHHCAAPKRWVWGKAAHKRVGFPIAGCSGLERLGPGCVNAKQPQWQPEPKETVGCATKCPDSAYLCLRSRTEPRWRFFGQYGP